MRIALPAPLPVLLTSYKFMHTHARMHTRTHTRTPLFAQDTTLSRCGAYLLCVWYK